MDFELQINHFQVQTIFKTRWKQLHSPLHCTGHLLDPEWNGGEWNNIEIRQGHELVMER